MGWMEKGVKCSKHPDEMNQPGVCSSCLRERLSQITTGSTSSHVSSSTINYPYPWSCSSSVSTSPKHRHHHHRRRLGHNRNSSAVMSSKSTYNNMTSGSGVDELKKSRSVAAAVVRRNRVGDVEIMREKKLGFWSRLTRKKI